MKRRVGILLFLFVLGGVSTFAQGSNRGLGPYNLDIQTGLGGTKWTNVTVDGADYLGLTAFFGIGTSLFADFLTFGGEYEFGHGWQITWGDFGSQWDGPYLMQHTLRGFAKLRALDYLSITVLLGPNVALPYGITGELDKIRPSFAMGIRSQVLPFYSQVDFYFSGGMVSSRISIGGTIPSLGNLLP